MNKNILVAFSSLAILGIFIYAQSQNEKEIEKKEVEPVASFAATKELLENLVRQLINLQKNIAEHSERLAGVFAKWKREGKIQSAEQWSQAKSTIQKLASELKIIANNRDLVEKLRKNKELFDILTSLNRESDTIVSKTQKIIPQIMTLSSLYGKSVATDKVLEKIEMLKPPEKSEKEAASPTEEPQFVDDTQYPSFEDYDFEEYSEDGEPPIFDEFELDDYSFDFGF